MKLRLSSTLRCSPEQAWQAVQTSGLLAHVAWPLLRFTLAGGKWLPDRWEGGVTYRLRLWLLALIPIGGHSLRFVRIDQRQREIETDEANWLIPTWLHTITIEPGPFGCSRYTDALTIDAGLFTLPVWLFAQWFYRHRQRRWRKLAPRLPAVDARRPVRA